MSAPIPEYHTDIFAPSALRNPFPIYREIRDLAPVVKLANLEIYALSRFKDVQRGLRTPEVLISGQGVGFNEISNTPQPSLIASDGETHRKVRNQMIKPLMPAELKPKRDEFKTYVAEQIRTIRGSGWIDGIATIARHLPVGVISFLAGLPEEGRQNMLRWASAGFNIGGPKLDGLAADIASIMEARDYLLSIDPKNLRPGSWAAALFTMVAEGKMTDREARSALRGYVLPALDTTIFAQGNLLYNLAANSDQWRLLKERRELIPKAVIESVRHSAIIRWFSRFAAADYVVEDFVIPAGSRVMIMYASANRDERRYQDPDRFDVTREAMDQLGWGTGPHMCAGMHLARIEMEILLETLVDMIETIEVGTPEVSESQGVYGYKSLPLRLN